jgi:hypothetical protein
VALGEGNLRLTQNVFNNWIEQVNNQAQGTREATRLLRDQGQRQQEAAQRLYQETTNTYSEYLNSALLFYREALSTVTQVAQQNMQQAAQQSVQAGVQSSSRSGQQAMEDANQAGQQGEQAASQAAQQGAESANQAGQQGTQGGEQVAWEGAPAAESVAAADTSAAGLPIQNYDNLRARSIVGQLGNLSPKELHTTRAYEQENKNREILLHMIDRRITAAS